MTGRLDALEQAGLVRRIRGTADRRRVDVELTDAGHAKWLAGMRFQDVAEREIVGVLDAGERERVNALLKNASACRSACIRRFGQYGKHGKVELAIGPPIRPFGLGPGCPSVHACCDAGG